MLLIIRISRSRRAQAQSADGLVEKYIGVHGVRKMGRRKKKREEKETG